MGRGSGFGMLDLWGLGIGEVQGLGMGQGSGFGILVVFGRAIEEFQGLGALCEIRRGELEASPSVTGVCSSPEPEA